MVSLHYLFECRCSRPIVLSVDMLDDLIVPHRDSTVKSSYVGIVCNACKRVGRYNREADTAVIEPRDNATVIYAGKAKCEDGSCGTPLLLFSLATISTDPEERQAELAAWKWEDDLRCPSDHPVRKPEGSGSF